MADRFWRWKPTNVFTNHMRLRHAMICSISLQFLFVSLAKAYSQYFCFCLSFGAHLDLLKVKQGVYSHQTRVNAWWAVEPRSQIFFPYKYTSRGKISGYAALHLLCLQSNCFGKD